VPSDQSHARVPLDLAAAAGPMTTLLFNERDSSQILSWDLAAFHFVQICDHRGQIGNGPVAARTHSGPDLGR
jgi:hypothetical protein